MRHLSASMMWAPPVFSRRTAETLLVKYNEGLFAPSSKNQSAVVVSLADPLKAVLLPFSVTTANVTKTRYDGEVGHDVSTVKTSADGKPTTETTTIWYPVSGKIGPHEWKPEDARMKTYAGGEYHPATVEEAFQESQFVSNLRKWDFKNVDLLDTKIDPYILRAAIARQIATQRLQEAEETLCEKHLSSRYPWRKTRVTKFEFEMVEEPSLEAVLLPGFALEHPGRPVQIVSALEGGKVAGPTPRSTIKVILAATVLGALVGGTVIPMFWGVASTLRIAALFAGVFGSVAGARTYNRLERLARSHESTIKEGWVRNQSVAESKADRQRRLLTTAQEKNSTDLIVAEEHYKALQIPLSTFPTKEMVMDHYQRAVSRNHPDHGGTGDDIHRLRTAKIAFLSALTMQRRSFSTRSGLPALPPASLPDSRARKLINAVLSGNCALATKLVEDDEISIDAHDEGENTTLTEAAKQGNLAAVNLALALGASVDTSCDCPKYNTALHYAVIKNHRAVAQRLIEAGARINLINADGNTALDLASSDLMRTLLIEKGAVHNPKLSGVRGALKSFLGYQREESPPLSAGEAVIALPPPTSKRS